MYPFTNPYTLILSRQREEEERRQREQQRRRGRFLVPDTWGGEEIPDDTARLARGRGLLAFGTSLLGLDAAKDPGAALGRGVSGFSDAMSGTLEEQRQIARQKAQDELQRAAEERRQQHETDYFENLRRDDEFRQKKAEQDAREEAAKLAAKEEERQAEIARRRALVEEVRGRDSALADQLDALVESDKFPYGEAVSASRAENPYAAAREERAASAAERAARAEERTLESVERQGERERQRSIQDRADEIFSDWLGGRQGMASQADRSRVRADALRIAEAEARRSSVSPAARRPEPPAEKKPASRSSIGASATPEASAASARVQAMLPSLPPAVRAEVERDLASGMNPADVLRELLADLRP